jgi:hypothetical protein
MTDDPLRDKIVLGQRVAIWLQDKALVGFLDEVEAEIIAEWRKTKDGEVVARERAWFALDTTRRLRRLLNAAVANGNVAQGDLDRLIANQEA